MATLAVFNNQGKKVEEIALNDKVFSARVNTEVIHQALVMYHAAKRQGNASTKDRGAVSGGGKKPWRQKGTGRARHASIRSPLWVKGGVTFGPHPRDFGYSVPKKIRLGALRESINAKYQAKTLFCIQDIKDKVAKTKDFAKILGAFNIKGSTLALLDGCEEGVLRASRNLPHFTIVRAEDVNAEDILSSKVLFLTKTAFNKLVKRVQF